MRIFVHIGSVEYETLKQWVLEGFTIEKITAMYCAKYNETIS